MQDYVREFYGIIQLIPKGRVATYGQIAKLAGLPKHTRYVGFALKNMDDNSAVPWHRIINSQGKISLSKEDRYGQNIQILTLQSEGVVVINGNVNLKQFQWIP